MAPRAADVGKIGPDEFEMKTMHHLLKKQHTNLYKHIYPKTQIMSHTSQQTKMTNRGPCVLKLGLVMGDL